MNQIDTTENIDNLFVTHSQVQILDPMSSAERCITSFLKKQNILAEPMGWIILQLRM